MDPSSSDVLVMGATGHVGQHVVRFLTGKGIKVTATTRLPSSPAALALGVPLLSLNLATATAPALAAACRGHAAVFFAMPQSFSPADMLGAQQRLVGALLLLLRQEAAEAEAAASSLSLPLVVKLSSYGIDNLSPTAPPPPCTQGPLGEAHREGEALFRSHALPLVSIRPTSFFSNFELYDWPGLRKRGRSVGSPLGRDARVNWVSCEDIGRVAAEVILGYVNEEKEEKEKAAAAGFRVVDVYGPPATNTLSAEAMCGVVSRCLGKEEEEEEVVRYEERPLPEEAAYRALWVFLRAGGFNVKERVGGREGEGKVGFATFVQGLVRREKEGKSG